MFYAYWLTSLITLENVQGDGYSSVEEAILDCLVLWHEDESAPFIVIRAGEDGPIVASIATDPSSRNTAIVTRLCDGTISRWNVEYVLDHEGQYVNTSIEEII